MATVAGVLLWTGWVCALGSLLCWWAAERRRVAVWAPLNPAEKVAAAKVKRLPAWLQRAAESLAERAAQMSFSGDMGQWERLLALAGRPYELTAPVFVGLRLVLVAAGLIFGNLLAFLGLGLIVPIGLALAGYFGPVLWLRSRAAGRQAAIGRALPDFLDTVACALEAGALGLDQALERVVPHFDGPLAEELGLMLSQQRLGTPRQQALVGLLQRTECRELELVIQALLQAERIGAPVADAFRIQADSVRTYRAQRARETAARVETKLTGIGTVVLAPISLLFILGLLVLNVIYNPAFGGWRSVW